MVKLHDLIKCLDEVEIRNDKNVDIKGIAYNSKNVLPGDLFVCIKGYKTDGHKYILDAVTNGAVALVVEEFQDGWTIPQIKVKNSREALSRLSDKFYGSPSQKIKVIGVTATNGKTSTTFMTNAVLENNGFKTGLIGTVAVKYGNTLIPASLTTPESLDLHRYFDKMYKEGVTHVTMEVSSSALDLKRVNDVDFDIVVFNNISREHIDLHGSFEEYFRVKSSLITNAKENKFAILNLDCPYVASLVDKTKAKVITYGVENPNGHIYCKNLDLSTGRAKFTVEIRKEFRGEDILYTPTSFDIELKTPGYHSVYNAMVAITVGLICGVPVDVIKDALLKFGGVERRFEIIYEEDFKIIDDHFANPGNIDVTLETLQKMKYNNLKLVYAIRGNRGPIVNRENAETIVKWASKLGLKEIIATLSRSHTTEKDKVQEEEVRVFKEVMTKAGINVILYDELYDAVKHAIKEVGKDDVILLAGCQGMDYGAKVALEIIRELNPNIDTAKLFKPLQNRVAGV
ncbi:Mur ligase family protein [Caldicellulosiruptor morganii]|uniref:UDP-N-acetylmuramoyl-L-alanyl-D-glutamate--2, 6-diaminopimelate ligase n=1 Tax=Caldicellulosiruptor morganii TaxID=1387555 RepID=A0ABY7BN04_9FIRM|nr:UDP-N-acetylmuramoyl-L-alanyl-D-glutamate--2,6-diaminopimelate ligase [Caldicellulosiruptor morganii]WAM34195.1 UDP-N-acetylmuramoyl-L-alanyl-D-glutamate--2,6-diaminopimelate ligase [Caldicellulosiruptor morganii]